MTNKTIRLQTELHTIIIEYKINIPDILTHSASSGHIYVYSIKYTNSKSYASNMGTQTIN